MKWIIALIMFLLVSTAYADPYEIRDIDCYKIIEQEEWVVFFGIERPPFSLYSCIEWEMEYNENTGEWTFGPEFKDAVRQLVIEELIIFLLGNQTSYSEGELR